MTPDVRVPVAATPAAAGVQPARRYLAYMAGNTTVLFLGMIRKIVASPHANVESFVFVIGDRHYYDWARAQEPDPRITLVYQHEAFDPIGHPPAFDEGRLAELEALYGAPNLWRFIRAHRVIDAFDDQRKARYLLAYLEHFESLARKYRPDVFITGSPDSLPFLVAQEVFSRHGAKPFILIPSRLPGRFHVVDNEMEQIGGLAEAYADLKRRPLTAAEQAVADDMRGAYTTRRQRPSYFGLGSRVRPVPSPSRLLTALGRLNVENRFFTNALSTDIRQSVAVRVRWPLQRWDMWRLTSALPADGRFFYYPLHYEPEFSIDILGASVGTQEHLIRRVASTLPAGYVLCLKEHPNMFPGSRPLGFYRRLAALGNVRLLDSRLDGYEIIAKCRAIVTISGTTGFEGLFHGKRVLLFGRAFYEVLTEGVVKAGSHEDIAVALQSLTAAPPLDPGIVDRFAVALQHCSHEGAYEHTISGIETDANHAALARGFLAELVRRTGERVDAA